MTAGFDRQSRLLRAIKDDGMVWLWHHTHSVAAGIFTRKTCLWCLIFGEVKKKKWKFNLQYLASSFSSSVTPKKSLSFDKMFSIFIQKIPSNRNSRLLFPRDFFKAVKK